MPSTSEDEDNKTLIKKVAMAQSNVIDMTKFQYTKKPKIFSASEGDDIFRWLMSYETCAKCNEWDDAGMLKKLPIFLDGYALSVYSFEIEPDANLTDWKLVKKRMISYFGPLCSSGQVGTFTSRKQSRGEPALKYILEMQSMAAHDDKAFSPELIFQVIRDGLRPEIRSAIRLHKPTDLAELKELCMEYEGPPLEDPQPYNQARASDSSNSELRELKEEMKAMKLAMKEKDVKVNAVFDNNQNQPQQQQAQPEQQQQIGYWNPPNVYRPWQQRHWQGRGGYNSGGQQQVNRQSPWPQGYQNIRHNQPQNAFQVPSGFGTQFPPMPNAYGQQPPRWPQPNPGNQSAYGGRGGHGGPQRFQNPNPNVNNYPQNHFNRGGHRKQYNRFRTPDGVVICHRCHEPGHYRSSCPYNNLEYMNESAPPSGYYDQSAPAAKAIEAPPSASSGQSAPPVAHAQQGQPQNSQVNFLGVYESMGLATSDLSFDSKSRGDVLSDGQKSVDILFCSDSENAAASSDMLIPVKVNGVETFGLCDSGADSTLVTARLVDMNTIDANCNITCTSAFGQKESALGTANLDMELFVAGKSKQCKVRVIVTPNLPYDVIIGKDSLKTFGLDLKFRKGCALLTMTSDNESTEDEIEVEPPRRLYQNGYLKATEAVSLPPRSSMFVNVSATGRFDPTEEASIEVSGGDHGRPYIRPPNAVFTCRGGKCQMLITNLSKKAAYIRPGERVAMFNKLNSIGVNMILEDQTQKADLGFCDVLVGKNLTESQKSELVELLSSFRKVFAVGDEIGELKNYVHKIRLKTDVPVYVPPRRIPLAVVPQLVTLLESWEKRGVIEKAPTSQYNNPLVLVRKADGKSIRACLDFRKLNSVSEKKIFPLPHAADVLHSLGGNKFFSELDLNESYLQIPLHPDSRPYTAFTSPLGRHQFTKCPFGIQSASGAFCEGLEFALCDLKPETVLNFIDNCYFGSKTFDAHLNKLRAFFERFQSVGMTIKPSKCAFVCEELHAIGFVISEKGIRPSYDKVRALMELKPPTDITSLQSVLGGFSYYRQFVKNFSTIVKPMTKLLRAGTEFQWAEEQQSAFDAVKAALTTAPCLIFFEPGRETELRCDASSFGYGAILCQRVDGIMHPVQFISKTISPVESRYSASELELGCIVFAVTKLDVFLCFEKFTVISDHQPLVHLRGKRDLTPRLMRMITRLSPYDFVIKYRPGSRMKDADMLSRNAVKEASVDMNDDVIFVNTILTQINIDDVRKAQEDDGFAQRVRREKDRDSNARAMFCERDGVLCKIETNGFEPRLATYLPPKFRRLAVSLMHDDIYSGHLGLEKTWVKFRERFYFPGSLAYVRKHIKTCHDCQSRKRPTGRPSGLLVPIWSGGPWQCVNADHLGPLSTSARGFRHVLVIVDHYTGFAITIPVMSTGAKETAWELLKVFCMIGFPTRVISDRGTAYVNKWIRWMSLTSGLKFNQTTAGHAQCNGKVERFNSVILATVSHFINRNQDNWDEILPFVTFGYNSCIKETTKFSPFTLLFARSPTLPTEPTSTPIGIPNPDDWMIATQTYMKLVHEAVEFTRSQTNAKDKSRYDQRRQEVLYEEGDLVRVFNAIRRKGISPKLSHNYHGPFVVLRRTSPVNYELQEVNGKKTILVHVSRMSRYMPRELSSISESESEDAEVVLSPGSMPGLESVTSSSSGQVTVTPARVVARRRAAARRSSSASNPDAIVEEPESEPTEPSPLSAVAGTDADSESEEPTLPVTKTRRGRTVKKVDYRETRRNKTKEPSPPGTPELDSDEVSSRELSVEEHSLHALTPTAPNLEPTPVDSSTPIARRTRASHYLPFGPMLFLTLITVITPCVAVPPMKNMSHISAAGVHGLRLKTIGETRMFDGSWSHIFAIKVSAVMDLSMSWQPRVTDCSQFFHASSADICDRFNDMTQTLHSAAVEYQLRFKSRLSDLMRSESGREWTRQKDEEMDFDFSMNANAPRGRRREKRRSRSLAPFIGEGLSLLFGIASEEDFTGVQEKLSQLEMNVAKSADDTACLREEMIGLSVVEDERARFIANALEALGDHVKDIDDLMAKKTQKWRNVSTETKGFILMQTGLDDSFTGGLTTLFNLSILANAIESFEMNLNLLRMGHLPSTLISREKLDSVLKAIEKETSPLYQLGLGDEDRQLYFTLPLITFTAMEEGLLVKLTVPLKRRNAESKFMLITPVTTVIPCRSEVCSWHNRLTENDTYVTLVTNHRSWLTTINGEELRGEVDISTLHCLKISENMLCISFELSLMRTVSRCSTALWTWTPADILNTCSFQLSLSNQYRPFKLTPHHVAIHSEAIDRYEIICLGSNLGAGGQKVQQWAEIITIAENCVMRAGGFNIPGPIKRRDNRLDNFAKGAPDFLFQDVVLKTTFDQETTGQVIDSMANDLAKPVEISSSSLLLDDRFASAVSDSLYRSTEKLRRKVRVVEQRELRKHYRLTFIGFALGLTKFMHGMALIWITIVLVRRGHLVGIIGPIFKVVKHTNAAHVDEDEELTYVGYLTDDPSDLVVTLLLLAFAIAAFVSIKYYGLFRTVWLDHNVGSVTREFGDDGQLYVNLIYQRGSLWSGKRREILIKIQTNALGGDALLAPPPILLNDKKLWFIESRRGELFFVFPVDVMIYVSLRNDYRKAIRVQEVNIPLSSIKWANNAPVDDFEEGSGGEASVKFVSTSNIVDHHDERDGQAETPLLGN